MSGPTCDVGEAYGEYKKASFVVLNDASIWRDETQSTERRLIAWPRPVVGTKFQRLLSVFFNADVDVVLALLHERSDPLSPVWPPDVRDPKMQTLLRVVQRSMEAGEAAIVSKFGGMEATNFRNFANSSTEEWADLARRSGLPAKDAFEMFGIVPKRAYRAEARVRKRTADRKK